MYSSIPIHWNIKSAPANSGRSRVGPAFYVFSFLVYNHQQWAPPPDYDTATPTSAGEYSAELLEQLMNSGRILVGFRFAMDVSKPLEVNVELNKTIPVDAFRDIRFA